MPGNVGPGESGWGERNRGVSGREREVAETGGFHLALNLDLEGQEHWPFLSEAARRSLPCSEINEREGNFCRSAHKARSRISSLRKNKKGGRGGEGGRAAVGSQGLK